jgi:thiol-disulfide isomerase/thioredoxin
MKKYKNTLVALFIVVFCSFLFTVTLTSVSAESARKQINPASITQVNTHPVVVYFFWGDGCPHCADAKPFLESLAEQNTTLEVRSYEVWFVEENQRLMEKMLAVFGKEPYAVPTIIIGNRYWEGFNEIAREEIIDQIDKCLVENCPDIGVGIIPGIESSQTVSAEDTIDGFASEMINLPLIGKVDLSSRSLWVSTLLISFVDGFNPCSIWVLTMLLAITLHAGSRKKVVIIGLVFLTVTAAIYAIFIAGLFTMLTVINFVGWIQVVVALVSLFFAVINIKDYFWYKEGLSFTISDEQKPGIFQKMRRVVDASQSFWGLVGATVVLAAGVSLVEFSCTAGFPVLWSNLLVSQNVTGATFVLLLLLYLVIYQLDEMAIFFTAVYSLRASKLEEKHGRLLKLVGGMLMLSLALVMIFNPALMNDLSSSLWIFGAAFAGTILVIVLHRYLLPLFGVRIGSEFIDSSQKKNRRH